ncbi:hypothetical protein [Leifsonia sp. 22587]|uniref:hypothetical protein n=1 Tax=Leifsonia sp. 22587 TaxID=3453946 RepID=UPI003F83D6E9
MATFTLQPPSYGKVVGRFLVGIGDGVDADALPDAVVPTGTITFTPSVKKVLIANGSPDPLTLELQPVTATIDSSGYLSFNNQPGVTLVATNDSNINPTDFTYSVQYNIAYSGGVIDQSKFDIKVPAASLTDSTTWTDLTKAAPVPTAAGTAIVKGDPGPVTDLTIGTVTQGTVASASITGSAPQKRLNLVLPAGTGGGGGSGTVQSINGELPNLSGDVSLGATDVGAVPNAAVGAALGVASLDIGGKVPIAQVPAIDYSRAAPWTMFVVRWQGSWPARPSGRSDLVFLWVGPDPGPAIVTSGTAGMLADVDMRDVVAA